MKRILSIVVLSLAASCDAYSPDLGYEPFQCGDDEPTCPLGYTCVTFEGGERICQQTGVEAPDAALDDDSSELECNDDGEVEPNDAMTQAYDSGIPAQRSSFEIVGLAICPGSDVDLFGFEIAASGTGAAIEITYRPDRGELLLDIINQSGTSVATGTADAANAGLVRATAASLPAGRYYAQVKATTGVENNYDRLSIDVQ